MTNLYLFIKAIHIISFTAWMAGMFYLPRIFVYHSEKKLDTSTYKKFLIMEKKLIKIIMTPAMIITWLLGLALILINNITIPAGTTPVLIADRDVDGGLDTALGHTVTPLLQGGAHFNPCFIGDVQGTLQWTGSGHSDLTGDWVFTRAEAGSEVIINRPTAIRTDFDINKNKPHLQVIFIGQNGGYNDIDELIKQHKYLIEHSQAKHTVILGLSSGSAVYRADYEKAMRKEFGRLFISLSTVSRE